MQDARAANEAAGIDGGQQKSVAANGTASTAGSNPTAGEIAAASSSQKIIERLSYQIETLKFDDSVRKVQSLCTELNGYVQDSSVTGSGIEKQDLRSASFVLRIPQEKLSQFKSGAGSIGSILNLTSSSENISESYYDTEARLKSLRTQQERLMALLQKSGSLTDIIALEKALADVNYQIEQYTGTLRQYDSLINYSTVSIQLNEVVKPTELEKTPVTLGEKISRQFRDSLRALGGFGEGLLVFVLGGAPVILLLAVIAAAVVLVLRKRRRSGKAAKKAEATFTQEQKEESSGDK
jgi:Na+-transporting methylmalonyl-CoA/oxaloacetate decarboxylase gamma subunit